MAPSIDIGRYFDKLTKQGRGGRRLDQRREVEAIGAETSGDADEDDSDARPSSPSSDVGPSRGGPGGVLKDVLGRSTTMAKRTAATVGRAATERLPNRLPGRRPTLGKRRGDLSGEGVVTIEYSPRRDGDPDPGEVVWTWVPFEEDPSQGKDRPVVIIGRRENRLVGIPLTTKPNRREAQLRIGTGGWDPKRRTSYARIWRMVDVDPGATRREGAVLDMRAFEQLAQTIDRYYDVRLPARSSGSGTDDAWDY